VHTYADQAGDKSVGLLGDIPMLSDVDKVREVLQRRSHDESQGLFERMHERVVDIFTKLLEVEIKKVGKI